jgi:hypothetical protein
MKTGTGAATFPFVSQAAAQRMEEWLRLLACALALLAMVIAGASSTKGAQPAQSAGLETAARARLLRDLEAGKPIVVHVFVALCDNRNQGIIPVPAALGNGQDPPKNLYWGARFGVATYLASRPDWSLLVVIKSPRHGILERRVYRRQFSTAAGRPGRLYLVADAYDGKAIASAIADFLEASAGRGAVSVTCEADGVSAVVEAGGCSHLVAYVGHNGLMDAPLRAWPTAARDGQVRFAIVLACASRQYFQAPLASARAFPLVWTTGLMAPEAYTLVAPLDPWIAGQSTEEVRRSAARSYSRWQRCSLTAAARLFDTTVSGP